ncbi:fibronectin type III domain-containing protein [Myxococcota bacterium]|nr:fibronectin type III domain-containing protein [Myxococcota bacterium]
MTIRPGIAAVLVSAFLAREARASPPRWVHLSFPQPDATRTVGVSWHSDSASDPSMVQFGRDGGWEGEVLGSATVLPSPLGVLHEATLQGLEPDTEYRYRVGGPGEFSQEFRFRTPPEDPCTPYSFGVLGDNRSDDDSGPSPRWFPIVSEALTSHPRFLLNTGDIVRDGKDPKQWANWLEASDQTLAVAPHLPTLGNHDDGPEDGDGAHYNRLFHLPRNEVTGTEDYYFFTTGNAIFVSLSTQTFRDFAAQAAWLDKVLSEHPRMWRFVFFHHPIHTSSSLLGLLDISHPPGEQGQNPHLGPVIDRHHVDFVFSGHNHFYERFQPLRSTGGPEGLPVGDPAHGTFYVVTGGAGALAYNIAVSLFCGSARGSEKCSGNHHFLSIEIARDELTFRARSTAQQLLGQSPSNSFDIEVFSYRKAWPGGQDPCVEPPHPDLPPEAAEPAPDSLEPDEADGPEPAVDPGPSPADPGSQAPEETPGDDRSPPQDRDVPAADALLPQTDAPQAGDLENPRPPGRKGGCQGLFPSGHGMLPPLFFLVAALGGLRSRRGSNR